MGTLHRIGIASAAALLCSGLLAQDAARARKPESPAVAQWRARIPAIQKLLQASDEQNCRGAPAPVIVDAFESSPERLSVALVQYCSIGAHTDSLFPIILDHGNPVQARFRGANGKTIQIEFVSGASVMHSRSAEIVPTKKAIFDEFVDNDGEGKISDCGVRAYLWNAQHRMFDLDIRLSKSASADYCRRVHTSSN